MGFSGKLPGHALFFCPTVVFHAECVRGFPRFNRDNDIVDHLPTLAFECKAATPKLIVELGTRGGVSTQALIGCARVNNAVMVSVDIDDCSHVASDAKWSFVRSDDLEFAKKFPEWCKSKGIDSKIDFLFIDTSHEYEHSVAEIAVWFPSIIAEMSGWRFTIRICVGYTG